MSIPVKWYIMHPISERGNRKGENNRLMRLFTKFRILAGNTVDTLAANTKTVVQGSQPEGLIIQPKLHFTRIIARQFSKSHRPIVNTNIEIQKGACETKLVVSHAATKALTKNTPCPICGIHAVRPCFQTRVLLA